MSNLSGTPNTGSSAKGARIAGDKISDHSGPGPDVMAASTLEGDAVRNSAGEDLGIRPRCLEVGDRREGVDDVAEGGELDDQDAHGASIE